ncbi:hypothetical protein KEJ15_05040 [Candidatus Bathyarchaeota archaeon]|nr:hypothetical protein [Candidatus Bathyarchaeota archaeon]
MLKAKKLMLYVFLTVLIEGCLMGSILALSAGLDLNDRTDVRYVARQYLYYVAYNIGYLIIFPFGMEYGNVLSGVIAWAIGCVGMFFAIYLLGEIVTRLQSARKDD